MYSENSKNSTVDIDLEASPASKPRSVVSSLPGIHTKHQHITERYRSRPLMGHGNTLASLPSVQQRWKQIHASGPRVSLECVDEIARKGLRGDALLDCLDRYCRIDLQSLQAVGGDRFPVSPMRVVGGQDR